MFRVCKLVLFAVSAIELFAQIQPPAAPTPFVNFETPTVHALDLSPSGKLLAACNLPEGRIEFFSTTNRALSHLASVPVGVDPVSVRFRTESELWVVNYISQTINIIDTERFLVIDLIQTAPRPTDVVFAGSPQRAFVTDSLDNRITVLNPITHEVLTNIAVLAQRPTALAVSPDGSTVYCTVKESGNRTTILSRKLVNLSTPSVPGAVQSSRGPYKGRSPVPNNDTQFDPPINSLLGNNTAPPVGIIVRKMADDRWRDDNDGDWTQFVSGTNAPLSGRIQGWDMLDHDLIILNANNFDLSYVDSLMTICLGIGVNPVDGKVTVVGTEALNQIRFEPRLNGVFARVEIANLEPNSRIATIQDLNPHLTYQTSSIPRTERIKSIGDPRGVQWTRDGTRCFVTGRGSDNLLILDAQKNRLRDPISLPEGPEALAINESEGRLYILNRFDASISVLDLQTLEVDQTIRLFDPTPSQIKLGRKFLYNTHLTSGLGHLSCATCHVDARMDRLAWDLGDPAGRFKEMRPGTVVSPGNRFHPMKGPMITQTFQDIIGREPFHWRGDRFTIEEFDITFRDLLGTERKLGRIEMHHFKELLKTITFPPNPYRLLDGNYSTNLPLPGFFASGKLGKSAGEQLPDGNALNGSRFGDCRGCHLLPTGVGPGAAFGNNSTGRVLTIPLAQVENLSFKAVHFRNLHERTGLRYDTTNSTAGFGFVHDGRVDSLERYLIEGSSAGIRFTNDPQVADVIAFLISANNKDVPTSPGARNPGAHASFGRQFALNGTNFVPLMNSFNTALFQQHGIELSVRGHIQGSPSHWLFNRTNRTFQATRRGTTMNTNQMNALVTTNSSFILTVLGDGSGRRVILDRDLDTAFDEDETANGSHLNRLATPANTAPEIEPIPDHIVELGATLRLEVHSSDKEEHRITHQFPGQTTTGATITSTGQFTFTPTTNQVGDFLFFDILAIDTGSQRLTNSIQFSVAVVPPLAISSRGLTTLSWASKLGQVYRLEYKSSLDERDWTVLTNEIPSKASRTAVTQMPEVGTRFYRLILD